MNDLKVDDKLLIAIDVGNSRIKLGLFKRDHIPTIEHPLPDCLRSMAIEVDEEVPWDELAQWGNHHPTSKAAVILGGVNPRGRDKIVDGWPATGWPQPVVIDSPFMLPLEIRVDSPRTVGMDRLLNAVAGNVIRPKNKAMIIVDSGTATTVDLVAADGAFEGGAILPGLQLGSRALHQYTALLPRILNEELVGSPAEPIGKNTRDAIRSGLFWGQLGGVKELLRHMCEQLGDDPVTVVTGGAGRLLAPKISGVLFEPYLALQGLVIVAQRLHKQ